MVYGAFCIHACDVYDGCKQTFHIYGLDASFFRSPFAASAAAAVGGGDLILFFFL